MKRATTKDPIKIFLARQERLQNSSWEAVHSHFARYITEPFHIVDLIKVIELLENKMELGYRSEDRDYYRRMPIYVSVSDKFLIQFEKVMGTPLLPAKISARGSLFFVLEQPKFRSSVSSVRSCVKALQRYQTKLIGKEPHTVEKLFGYVKQ